MYCMLCGYANSECLVSGNLCELFLCVSVFGTIKTAFRCNTVVLDGNYNGLRSVWSREEEELNTLPASLPGSSSAGQSSKGQKVKMGGGFPFLKQEVISPSVRWSVWSLGLLVTLAYGFKGRHCRTNPTWERSREKIRRKVTWGFLHRSPRYAQDLLRWL